MSKTIHGIDLTAPGGIRALLDFHRRTFGDAQMNANADGGETGDTGPQDGQATPTETPAAPTTTPTPAAPQNGAQPPAEEAPAVWEDPAAAKAEIERLRAENGRTRINAKEQAAQEARDAIVKDLGKALGLVKDDDQEVDPAALAQQITEKDQQARQAQTELAVYRAAAKAGADADALLDSRSFLAALEGLDPTDSEKITTAIKTAVENNPKLKIAQAAGRSGAEFNGGPGEQRTKAGSLTEALTNHYSTH